MNGPKPLYPRRAWQQVDRAVCAWNQGDRYGAGRLLYEALEAPDRPAWAGQQLALVCARTGGPEAVHRILNIAFDAPRWSEAREAFQAARQLLLENDRQGVGRDDLLERVLALAELVAKVSFNATGLPAPYDHHAGWRVPRELFSVLALLARPELEVEAEQLLFGAARH